MIDITYIVTCETCGESVDFTGQRQEGRTNDSRNTQAVHSVGFYVMFDINTDKHSHYCSKCGYAVEKAALDERHKEVLSMAKATKEIADA